MRDTVDLEDRGVPSVFVSTVEFVDGADAQAKALGTAERGLRRASDSGSDDDEMRAIADAAVDEVVARIVARSSISSGDSS